MTDLIDNQLQKAKPVLRDGFFFSSRRRHTRLQGDWSSDVCSSDLAEQELVGLAQVGRQPSGVQVEKGGDRLEAGLARGLGQPPGVEVRLPALVAPVGDEIGRASCRERVEDRGGRGALKKSSQSHQV